jgi:hypothetical protein
MFFLNRTKPKKVEFDINDELAVARITGVLIDE